LVGGGRAWLASRRSPASVDFVGATPLLAKRPLEEFCLLRRLGALRMKSPTSCWHSRPFGRSQPLWPNTVVIPGTSAGRWLCPWPTQIVIPMTLAPKTGEVSWVSVGLQRAVFLAEVNSHPSKSQDPSSSSEVVDLEVNCRGVSLAISGRAGSRTEPAGGFLMAASRRLAPRVLDHLVVWTHAATDLKRRSVTSHHLDLFLVTIIISFYEASRGVTQRAPVARPVGSTHDPWQ
jgi:hypothetical protein